MAIPMDTTTTADDGNNGGGDDDTKMNTSESIILPLKESDLQRRLEYIQRYVGRQIPSARDPEWIDPGPKLIQGSSILIGSKYHAADLESLRKWNVTAVLNCASGGISRLPLEKLQQNGIRYVYTNVKSDDYNYPILHDKYGVCSQHLQVAKQLYYETLTTTTGGGKGTVLFFCVAGQNRSPTLGIATLMLFGYSLNDMIQECSTTHPFILENVGFQQQLVELEYILKHNTCSSCMSYYPFGPANGPVMMYEHGGSLLQKAPPQQQEEGENEVVLVASSLSPTIQTTTTTAAPLLLHRSESEADTQLGLVEIELLIPGLCTMDVKIPRESSISTVKQCLVEYANKNLLMNESVTVAKSWLVVAMFGYDDMYDLPLEKECIELEIQLQRLQSMFHLDIVSVPPPGTKDNTTDNTDTNDPIIRWTSKCRFALVIFSVNKQRNDNSGNIEQVPWTFVHEERVGAPATLLENTLMSTHLRAWDFITGQSYCSQHPIVFSYNATDLRDRRSFMKISTSSNEAQQFHAPGEGGILGMGANAIVHRVQLVPTLADGRRPKRLHNAAATTTDRMDDDDDDGRDQNASSDNEEVWDAAVKRPFNLPKMLGMLANSSEAGMAKRVRSANLLNSDGRVLYFYGLGVALSSNAYNQKEYKFEATLLARYEEEFSTYTMRQFMEDYIQILDQAPSNRRNEIQQLQSNFSLISVKVLLVSLLNAFRDLSLIGLQAFDFSLNNVLVSKDFSTVKLLDIDGNSRGSIQFPSEYILGGSAATNKGGRQVPHKPSLDVNLNVILPTVVQQLLLGKGKGNAYVTNKKSEIWRASEEEAKRIFKNVIRENFFPHIKIMPSNSTGQDDVVMEDIDKNDTTTATATVTTTNDNSWILNKQHEKHLSKLAEWFYAMLKKQPPWENWTNDIYDAVSSNLRVRMKCLLVENNTNGSKFSPNDFLDHPCLYVL